MKEWTKWKRAAFSMLNYPVLTGFAFAMKWHHAYKGTWKWWVGALLLGPPVYILDVVWTNWIWGTLFWNERPRELTYTERLSKKVKAGHPEAIRQCRILNKHDPDHC